MFSAALAGLVVGTAVTAAQMVGTAPLIQQSEVYERKAEAAPVPAPTGHQHAAGHDHGAAAWEPADGLQRNAFTFGANILTAIGFGMLLTGIFALRGRPVDWREGLLWGLGGFVVFTVAPGLGLPPELPGTASAALTDRQVWWAATAVLTAGALALLFYVRAAKPVWVLLAVAMLVAPHLIGAPQPAAYASAAPESLAHRFVALTAVAMLLSWLSAGVLSGYFYKRFVQTG